jgi:hypothetical protein
MRFTLVALALGVALGLVQGGRLANVGRRSFRWLPVLVAGALLQAVDRPVALALSYLLLLAFALGNLRVPALGVLAVGLGLNAAVVIANGAMPVHQAGASQDASQPTAGKHRAERPGDSLTPLDDRIDLPPLGEVLSLGDVVLAVGLCGTAASLVRRPPEGRHAQLADDSAGPRLR